MASPALLETSPMRHHQRSITWQGQAFRFQRLQPEPSTNDSPLWAVYRRGEFIGTMLCSGEVTTKDFDVRSLRWLGELLGASGGAKPLAPNRSTSLH
jgi:hypothetical protein